MTSVWTAGGLGTSSRRARGGPASERVRARELHLLDGTYELFRAYFAQPARRSPDGREVGAIRGLLATVLALLDDPRVTYVAAATDHVIESFRNRLFPGYKTGENLPEDLISQFPLAEEALETVGLRVWPMVEFEADDALATAAARFAERVDRVVLLSPDKDLAQCVVNGRVVLHDRRRGKTYDEDGVREKFGVGPASIPDYLALVGDAADGIPGLPGWGPRSAAALLAIYERLEEIPDDPARWPVSLRRGTRLAACLAEHRREAMLFKTLATLRTDVPLDDDLEDLRFRGTSRDPFHSFCRRLGFRALADRPKRWA